MSLRHTCSRSDAPLMSPGFRPEVRVAEEEALGSVRPLLPHYNGPINMTALAEADEPALLREVWPPARNWSWGKLRQTLRGHMFVNVMRTAHHHYLPPDDRAALSTLLSYSSAHSTSNVSAEELIDELSQMDRQFRDSMLASCGGSACRDDARRRYLTHWRSRRLALLHFDVIPKPLEAKWGRRQRDLYVNRFDATSAMQYVWLSSPAHRTHTHFDSDRNAFVQLLGTKRFVLWSPNQTSAMCPFPRLHPLWHKSRVDFEAPDLSPAACANYSRTNAFVVDVQPGDVLYVPPYWWHTVESTSASLSLSTLSRWPQLYIHLNAVYRHEHFFDRLALPQARVYGLRAFFAQLLRRAQDATLLSDLLLQYESFEPLFAGGAADAAPGDGQMSDGRGPSRSTTAGAGRLSIRRGWATPRPPPRRAFECVMDERGTPTCQSCLQQVNFDVQQVWDDHLMKLPPGVRRVAMMEMMEEVTANVLGASEALGFWRHCFGPGTPRFFLTKPGSDEHKRLWQTIDNTDKS